VQWYLDNPIWIEGVVTGSYRDWLQKQYRWKP
jgi:dTDP-glucose 4,6-dehydratase